VFSALGFYPVCPGSGQYALGTPLFKQVLLHLKEADVEILAPENSATHFYVKELKLNDEIWRHNYLKLEDLQKGARLDFTMSCKPARKRGIAREDRPYSLTE